MVMISLFIIILVRKFVKFGKLESGALSLSKGLHSVKLESWI